MYIEGEIVSIGKEYKSDDKGRHDMIRTQQMV